MALKRQARLQERRSFLVGLVRRILLRLASGDLDAQEGCAQVRKMYLDESELLKDLEPLASVAGDRSREEIVALAEAWLRQHPAEG